MRLLMLAGTGEARELASALEGDSRVTVIASLAGATRTPRALGVTTRIGGFGGREGFAEYLRQERIDAVLDATHPFAATMSHRTAEVCRGMDVPYVQFLRPPWEPVAGDRWTDLASEEDAAEHIQEGSTVFVATGRQTLARFGAMPGREMIVRLIDRPSGDFPFASGYYLRSRPPFTVEQEVELFRRLAVDWLVVKNAGGAASRAKLDAARQLNLRVAMIRRPPQPDGPKVGTIPAALNWVRRLS